MFCLRAPTDSAWAHEAVKDLDAVLVDHAHCEMKAATNALSLAVRHSSDLGLVRALTEIAREELVHFTRVVELLEARGLALGAPPVDDYAAQLRRAMKALPPSTLPLVVDRLLVGALIEARSCERFKLLLQALPESSASDASDIPDLRDLRDFYRELFEAEARHYREYVDLAIKATPISDSIAHPEAEVEARLRILADEEAGIIESLASRDARGSVHG